jgi:hypothetical protein
MQSAVCASGDGIKAIRHVNGITYDENYGDYKEQVTEQEIVTPYCSDWWQGRLGNGDDFGLRSRLLDYAKSLTIVDKETGLSDVSFYDKSMLALASLSDNTGFSLAQAEYENVVIRNILSNSARNSSTAPSIATDDPSIIANIFGLASSASDSMFASVKVQVIKNNMYLVLAFGFLVLLVTMPFIHAFGMFTFNSLAPIFVFFLLLKVTPFFWHVTDIIDNELIEIMGLDTMWSNLVIGDNAELVRAQNAFVVDLMVMGLYVGLPFLFLKMLNTVSKAAPIESAQRDMSSESESTGSSASNQAQKTTTSATNRKSKKS